MSMLLAYKLVWAQIVFSKEPMLPLHLKAGPVEQNWTHMALHKTSSRAGWCKTLQFSAEFLPCGARQGLVYIQHWDVLMFLLGQLPSSFVVEQPCYLKNRIIFEMAY